MEDKPTIIDVKRSKRLKLLEEYMQNNGYSKCGLQWGALIENESHNQFDALRIARHDFRDLLQNRNITL